MTDTTPRHWADTFVDTLISERGNGPFLIASGITPSGPIHVGNSREVLTADIIHRVLTERGIEAKHYFIADDYDSLRRVYPFLDEEKYTPYIGAPLSEIPSPDDREGVSYADYFLEPFAASLKQLKVQAEVKRASEFYAQGAYKKQIVQALNAKDEIARILNEVTGKEIKDDWSPFLPQCSECNSMVHTRVTSWNADEETVSLHCLRCDTDETVPIVGHGKLTWRIDWPARWAALGVSIEPFGKDHGGKGGSYDTGKLIAKNIFNWDAPFPIIYEWIRLKGLGDMSSSKGNVVAVQDVLDVVPPDVLRYFVTRPAPKTSLALDPVTQLLNLVDEVDDPTTKQRDHRAAELSHAGGFAEVGVPFNHLINVFQVAQGEVEKVKDILSRTGYTWGSDEALEERCAYADKWLKRFAPENYIFCVSDTVPDAVKELSDVQKTALEKLADALEKAQLDDGDAVHQLIYDTATNAGLGMGKLCQAFYAAMIGKNRGPRAGWFVVMIGTDLVVNRLREAAAA